MKQQRYFEDELWRGGKLRHRKTGPSRLIQQQKTPARIVAEYQTTAA
jgi:hypothetical protein